MHTPYLRLINRSQEALTRIVEEAGRAGRVVRSIRRFARHEPSSMRAEDLGAVVGRSVELVRQQVEDSGGTIELAAPSAALFVMMSPMEIDQLVVNLVLNAAESRPAGARVRVGVERRDGRAVLEVADDGLGLTDAVRSQAFDLFFTTRQREGRAGIGLAIVDRIVRDHGGEIRFEDTPDGGTTVRVEFGIAAGPFARD